MCLHGTLQLKVCNSTLIMYNQLYLLIIVVLMYYLIPTTSYIIDLIMLLAEAKQLDRQLISKFSYLKTMALSEIVSLWRNR